MTGVNSGQLSEDDYDSQTVLPFEQEVDSMLTVLASRASWATLKLTSENPSNFEAATYAHISKTEPSSCARKFVGTFAQTTQVGVTRQPVGRGVETVATRG